MRRTLTRGLALTVAVVVAGLLGSVMDLELDATLLLGAAAGAVVALVPDGTPSLRLAGFAAGAVAGLLGFVVRAAVLPDSTSGRLVALALVLVLCTGLALVSAQRLSLWSTLLGAGVWAGAYERVYALAPTELPDSSVQTLTALLLAVAVGFVATVVATPSRSGAPAVQLEERPREVAR